MNHSRHHTPSPPRPLTRLATFAWSLLAICLLATLLFLRQAEAATAPVFASAPQATADFEDEAEFEEDEGEEGEDEEFEDEEDEGLGNQGPLFLPPECLVHTAEAQVAASASRGVVQLTIHYTSYEPTNVSVEYWLKGGKGSLALGESKRHFNRQGVFREDSHLSDHAMSKVLAARTFIVQLGIPAAPSSCAKYATQRLTVKHGGNSHATWSRPH